MSNKLYNIRRSEIEDSRGFSDLVNSQGGQALFRATFGQFNFSNLVEYSYLSLSVIVEEDQYIGFAAFNDLNPVLGDFDQTINKLKDIIACNVILIYIITNYMILNFKYFNNHIHILGDKYFVSEFPSYR